MRRCERRANVLIDGFVYIGKESNKLEAVEEGGAPSESDIYTAFNEPRRQRVADRLAGFADDALVVAMELRGAPNVGKR
jgi:hypothetical protein